MSLLNVLQYDLVCVQMFLYELLNMLKQNIDISYLPAVDNDGDDFEDGEVDSQSSGGEAAHWGQDKMVDILKRAF